jgi:hypothetical protein
MVKSAEQTGPPPQPLLDAIAQLRSEAARAGVFIEVEKLLSSAAGAVVRIARGKMTVTRGPFSEQAAVIAGYAVYEVVSKAEAIEWTCRFLDLHRQHWPGWEGEVEVRQLRDGGERL